MQVLKTGVQEKTARLSEIIGGGYRDFWESRARYRVIKGGRGSKKSCTTALWLIYHMMKMPLSNAVVVRRYFNTHRDSTFAQLMWAINKFNAKARWVATKNPLCLTYKPTGQKILFRGFDDPQSITSITVETGVLCWVWIEEAFQITNEAEFNKLDLSIRGKVPEGYFKQITATFNPWSENIFWKKRFFDEYDRGNRENIYCATTNFLCNEFLDEADLAVFEDLKKNHPRRFDIEGMGNWGIAEGLIFNDWREWNLEDDGTTDPKVLMKELLPGGGGRLRYQELYGLDWGFAEDPTAFIALLADPRRKRLYIFDELYLKHALNETIVHEITAKDYASKIITADSSEPKSIEEVRMKGLHRIRAAKKGPDSVRAGILKLQAYTIIVHPSCSNTLVELNNYVWDTNQDGKVLDKPIDEFSHLMDALRYACEKLEQNNFSF